MTEQEELWEVIGGIGGRRVACDLPSRAEAERVASDFAARLARLDVPATSTYIRQQSRRYGSAR